MKYCVYRNKQKSSYTEITLLYLLLGVRTFNMKMLTRNQPCKTFMVPQQNWLGRNNIQSTSE